MPFDICPKCKCPAMVIPGKAIWFNDGFDPSKLYTLQCGNYHRWMVYPNAPDIEFVGIFEESHDGSMIRRTHD
jgi:hypothetical protein